MAKLKDFYGELGVAPSSEVFVIQAAYRAMLKRYHPDVNRSADAARKTIRINEAYKVLSDPETRARYDRALKTSRKAKESAQTKNSDASSRSSNQKEPPKAERSAPPPPPVEPVYAPPRRAMTNPSGSAKAFFALTGIVAFLLFAGYVSVPDEPKVAQATDNLDAPMDAFESFDQNSSTKEIASSLGTQDAPQIDFGTIESAAQKYTKILFSAGVIGARKYSETCHATALETPTWAAFDQCAAFDYAAAHIDDEVADQIGAKSSYFQFQSENMQRFYTAGGADSVLLYSRLADLKKFAGQAAEEAVESEVSQRKKAEESRLAKEAADELLAFKKSQEANETTSSTDGPTYTAPNGEIRSD